MNLEDARKITFELARELSPFCERFEVAGSIRRRVESPGDIDLVVIPSRQHPRPVFGKKPFSSSLEQRLSELQDDHQFSFLAGGDKLKRYSLYPRDWGVGGSLLPVKLQITIATPDNWAYWLLIRTGPAEFSHWIVTPQSKGGAIPDCIVYKDFHLWRTGEESDFPPTPIFTPDETAWLHALDLPYIEPWDRRPRWKKA